MATAVVAGWIVLYFINKSGLVDRTALLAITAISSLGALLYLVAELTNLHRAKVNMAEEIAQSELARLLSIDDHALKNLKMIKELGSRRRW